MRFLPPISRFALTLAFLAPASLSLAGEVIPAAITGSPQTELQLNDTKLSASDRIVAKARERTYASVRYDPRYVKLSYPFGDVDEDTGVCTDVVIRTYRNAFGFDFQKAVHEDIKANFSAYPNHWGLSGPDKNIDHRRVPNLETYLKRQGAAVPITKNAEDYRPGDIVSWRLGGRVAHIGIISDRKSPGGTPLVIHNIGQGPVEDNILWVPNMTGHFRFVPPAEAQNLQTAPAQ